jgi:hypothetical protein
MVQVMLTTQMNVFYPIICLSSVKLLFVEIIFLKTVFFEIFNPQLIGLL